MSTFTVYGSSGELAVSSASGRAVEYVDYGGGEYADITFFNVEEWRRAFPGQMPDHVDILDLGYWIGAGAYEPPEVDWRHLMASEGC